MSENRLNRTDSFPGLLRRAGVLILGVTMLLSFFSDAGAEKVREKGTLLSASSDGSAEKDKKRPPNRLTPVELQSRLMSFGDRFATIIDEAFLKFAAGNPTQEARMQVRTVTI